MPAGRKMAQASHAANAFIHTNGSNPAVKEWQNDTTQGFGTAIVLGATEKDINNIISTITQYNLSPKSNGNTILCDRVCDPDYRVPVPIELISSVPTEKIIKTDKGNFLSISCHTCAYVFGDVETVFKYLDYLELHP